MNGDKDLLCWAIEHSEPRPADSPPAPLDPAKLAFLQAALGDSDAKRMTEAVRCVSSATDSAQDRLTAWDNLELLVESGDNAQDVEKLRLWPQILGGLEAAAEEERVMALWVVGTAAQNNPAVQDALLRTHRALPRVLSVLRRDGAPRAQKKALYALSSLLCLNGEGKRAFYALDGLGLLRALQARPDLADRIEFIMNAVLPDPDGAAAEK